MSDTAEHLKVGDVANLTIHIVCGRTGEYSDRDEWIVRAYSDEAKARAEVERLTETLARLLAEAPGDDTWKKRSVAEEAMHVADDPNCSIDYTGTSYYLQSCPLKP